MEGYIRLHRKLLDWQWFSDTNTLTVFVYCLLRASYKDRSVNSEKLKPGQFICSVNAICRDTGLTTSKVRTSLKKLEKTGELANKSQGNYSVISISNWEKYQTDDNGMTNESQTNDNQIATNKKGKKEKGKNNNISSSGRGSKLSEDWKPTEKDIAFAKEKGWTNARIENEVANFVEHFTNGNGRKYARVDWSKSWQTWVRKNYGGNKQPEIWDGMRPRNNANAWEEQERLHRSLANK